MKPDKFLVAAAGILLACAGLIALTWLGANRSIDAQSESNTARVTASLSAQALMLSDRIDRQLLAVDQTLRVLATAWAVAPAAFDLNAWHDRTPALNGLTQDMVLTGPAGIIRQSSVNEAIGQNASGLDYFRALTDPSTPRDTTYVGPATIDGIMRQWHMNVARALRNADGSFAGVLDTDYRIAAFTDVFGQTEPGANAFVALVGLDDGKLRGSAGPAVIEPGASVDGTPLFAAIKDDDYGVWTGPSASDSVTRIHAFHHIAARNLAVVVGMSEDEANLPVTLWRREARFLAGCTSALLAILALVLIQGTRLARQRKARVAEDRAMLAAANAQLAVAAALTGAKAEQLEATLSSMSDGVSIFDSHLCLVEWNARFPDLAGVPAAMLRTGLPIEHILRAQVESGQFGPVADPPTEVAQRLARLRATRFGAVRRQVPDGRTIELTRNRLPDGGFVTLYADVTEHEQAEAALREVKAAAEAVAIETSRYAAIASHEIKAPLNALLCTIGLLHDTTLTPGQRSLLAKARHAGDMLSGLTGDILELSRIDSGTLTIRPSLFGLRSLMDACAAMFGVQAAERGIAIQTEIGEGTPDTLFADPDRLRQVLVNLLWNAVKYARPGTVWLIAGAGTGSEQAVRLSVRDDGPVIAADAQAQLFQPFSRAGRSSGDDPGGAGLGLAICRRLASLMGGQTGYEPWHGAGGAEGNMFWVALPATALPLHPTPGPADALAGFGASPDWSAGMGGETHSLPNRLPPRTRILLTEDVEMTQRVTAALLRREGHCVDIAPSGPAAIAAMRAAPYDLVFMDIFMPGMTGQEAVRTIRTLEEPACSVPVVALTAASGPEDEALFKAAGMDGFLRKPPSAADLRDVVAKYVWARPVSPEGVSQGQPATPLPSTPLATPPLAAPPLDAPPLDARVLNTGRIEDLRGNLPAGTFAALIEECLSDMDHRLPALRRALAAGAPGAVSAHAHALLGMAAGYGMASLEARLRDIVAAARQGDLTVLGTSAAAAVQADFTEAARALQTLCRNETEPMAVPD